MNPKAMLGFVLLLSACGSTREQIAEQLTSEYSALSCDDLKKEYRFVLEDKVDAFKKRMNENDMNLIVTSSLNILSSGNGGADYNRESVSEEDTEIRMEVLRKILRSKNCSKNSCKTCKGASL